MADQLARALQYAHENREKFLDCFKEFLSLPSISTDPEHSKDVQQAARWLAAKLSNLGMKRVNIHQTKRHPIVYGEMLESERAPTVLIYGHYDVQPADPLEKWITGPFSPQVTDENIIARGASDMKGENLVILNAVESILSAGKLPVNIKWLFEGEEEIGSPNLPSFIAANKELLSCDFALNTDSGMIGQDYPTITYALRGLAYFELRVSGPMQDLHSGIYGGAVHNPANALAELIAGMHAADGRVTLPGFYDRVVELTPEDKMELERLPIDDTHYLKVTGVPELYGEKGYTTNERTGARPTLDVNGMISGFTGQGSKTIIPSWAMAKISMRLVPDQKPEEVHQQFKAYLSKNAPRDIRWELTPMAGGPASISDKNNQWVQAMMKALESVWGSKPYYRREGGSIPVVREMQNLLGIESVICGFGLPDDNVHSPNEKMHLPTWYRGIDAIIRFFDTLGKNN